MQAELNPHNGRMNFSDPEMPRMLIEGGVAWVRYCLESGKSGQATLNEASESIQEGEVVDAHGSGKQRIIRCQTNTEGIELTFRIRNYDQQPFLLLQLSVSNQGGEPVFLKEMCLFQADPSAGGKVKLSRHNEGLDFFKVGWHGWDYAGLRHSYEHNNPSKLEVITGSSYTNPVTPSPRARGDFWSEGWGILEDGEAAIVAGFVTTARQFGQVHVVTQPDREALMLITQMDGIQLDPGETSDSEWGYLQFLPLPDVDPAASFVKAVARQMNARTPDVPPAPMWTHWYHFYHDISEALFLQNLEVLKAQHENIPFEVVELDDGYQSAWGDWTSTNEKFPNGLKKLAVDIIQKGFTPGLWLSPFVVEKKSQIVLEHPDWLVKNQHGKPIDAGFVYNMFTQALDASHPAVLEHLRTLAHTLTHQWGYKMLKVDFMNAGALPGKRYNPKVTRAEALRMGLEAIRQGAGEKTFLLASGCPFGPAIGIMDAMRIGPDTAPSWKPWFNWLRWAGPFIRNEPSMPSLRNALRHTMNMSTLNKRWWWNDPDCLLVRAQDTSLTVAEVQSAVTLVGLSGGMLVSSDDLSKVSPERINWVRAIVPNLGLSGLPIDWWQHEMAQIYQLKMKMAGGTWQSGQDEQQWQVVALFNWNDHPDHCNLRLADLGFEAGAKLCVFDFWSERYQETEEPAIVFSGVPAHGCKLLRVCRADPAPLLVGDTLHISQGGEISSMVLQEDRLVIETMDLGRRVEGQVWLRLDHFPREATCNGNIAEVTEEEKGVYAIGVRFFGEGRIDVLL